MICFVMTMIDGGVLCVKSKVTFFFFFFLNSIWQSHWYSDKAHYEFNISRIHEKPYYCPEYSNAHNAEKLIINH